MHPAHEVAEKIEHAAHPAREAPGGGHRGPEPSGRFIGLTMAILGVMLALCAAMVGSERTELIKTMVEQSNQYNEYQAASTKYRVLLGTLQQVYAETPSRRLTAEALARLDEMPVPAEQKAMGARANAGLKELVALLTPRTSEVEGFMSSIHRYDEERCAAHAWAESYSDAVQTHFESSERFERAQLVAEIGIVIASIALLLHSRVFWFVSIAAAVVCVAIIGFTMVKARGRLHADEKKIEDARERYQELRGQKDANGKRMAEVHDEEELAKIRERFGIAAEAPADEAPAPPPHH